MPPTALSESRIIDGESEDDPITINELQEIARRKLPKKNFYEYYECGADDQVALGKNRKDFDRLYICHRVLRDVSRVSTSTRLWGHELSVPIGIAPGAMHKLASPEGENAVARAAFKMGLNMTLYSQSTTPLKMVISARQRYRQDSMAPFWFQIYFTAD